MWAEYDGDFIHLHRRCPFCRQAVVITCEVRGYNAWQDGMLIQEALPELSPGERETLRSGYHERCYDILHGEEDRSDEPPEYDPGDEADDEGGMSEHRHLPTSEAW